MGSTDKQKVACPLFREPADDQMYQVKGIMILDGIGRLVTGSRTGSYLTVDASYENYGEAIELRYAVTDWADVDTISQFQGIFLAVENRETNASGTLRGMEVQARDNDVGTGSLCAIHTNVYIKGSTDSKTIGSAFGIQPQIEFASSVGTRTVGTIAAAIQGIVYTAGTITGLTNIHGIDLKFGDQDGQSTTIGSGIQMSSDTGTSGTRTLTTGLKINIACTTAISITADCGNGLIFNGTFTDDVVDFTDVTIDHTGSNGPCFIRAGTYASPVTNADEDQSGMIRLYGETTADGSSYDRGIFICLKTQGAKGIFPVAGLAEGKDGCTATKIQAAQFIAHLNHTGATLSALGGDTTAGMYGAWLRITANDGATTESGSRAAPLWIDNQLYGSNINAGMEEYGIFATTGGSKPDALIGLETSSSGWSNLLYFDETSYDQDPIMGLSVDTDGGDSTDCIRISLNGTPYYIPIFDAAS